ncbi:hypothetical protein AYJ00_04710 [Shewanella algae]|uniref:DEAD/DEAH box helicase n=1 Tax=Shewanella algae TaxID=38313 RepID=UPI0011843E98|nr:AAA domain-containing protein [Shewanella algae]TVL55345.1 hypothetical protein AYJ00_04710 [Shewanella algae]
MKLADFRFFDPTLHCIHFVDSTSGALNWQSGKEVRLVSDKSDLIVSQNGLIALVRASDPKTKDLASTRLGLWRLAQLGGNHVHLEHAGFQLRLSLDLKIAVDGYLAEQLSNEALIAQNSVAQANDWLKDEFILELDEPMLIARYFQSQERNDFQLVGKSYSLSIFKDGRLWRAKKLTKLRRDDSDLIALVGNAEFVDDSVAARVNASAVDVLEQHINNSGSYLSLWETYSKLQWNIATRAAKKLGYIPYSAMCHSGKEIPRFRLNVGHEQAIEFGKRIKALQDNDELGTTELIFEITDEPPSWMLEQSEPVKKEATGRSPLLGRDIQISPPYIEIEIKQNPPPQKGIILLSIQGDKTAYERRERAYRAIQLHQNPMPQLRMLLEGIEPPVERARTLTALSTKARKRFKGEPTARQKDALKVALNTPDVALIIGPPGTGKTQVITALQQRIVDEFSDNSSLKHQVLLTSFQHDAVENVVGRSGVFGLPAVKVGGRRFGGDASENPITKWRIGKILSLKQPLEAELKSWPEFGLYEQLKETSLSLRMSRDPGSRRALSLEIEDILTRLSNEHDMYLSNALSDSWQRTLVKHLKGSELQLSNSHRLELLRVIRGLRTSIVAFNDDGDDRLADLLKFAETIPTLSGHPTIARLRELQHLLTDFRLSEEAAIEEIISTKEQLIDAVRPDYRPYLLRSYIDEADCSVLDEMESELYGLLSKSRVLGPLIVRHEYIEALENQAYNIEKSIEDYVTIIGATCQQAAGDQMLSLKETTERQGITFNTVIVDEAARASPLDLMIPMAMAKRRIVLVGDHLQLPHMLEPRVETELQEQHELDAVNSELLRISLFEHLYRQFKEMHKNGGPERVVMLDTQFRMHPVLGRFVSREFYERRGFDPIEPGLSEAVFEHGIEDYQGCCAAWVDVPKELGLEQKRHGSRLRTDEAKRCAEEASKLLNAYPDISVGIITFYSAQRDAIYEELAALGFAEHTEDGWQIGAEYRINEQGEERLRVGSVDAFQGKEFDVVILSVVRTWTSDTEINTESLNRKLGFLRLPNRINVAMSRQKKLLIVVGDKELRNVNGVNPEDNMPLLPGFPAFFELCEGAHGKIL